MSFQHALSFRLALQNHRQEQKEQQQRKDHEFQYQAQKLHQPNELPYQPQHQQGPQPGGQCNSRQKYKQRNNNEFRGGHQQSHQQQSQSWWDGQHFHHPVGRGGGRYYQDGKHQPARRQQYPQQRRGGRGSNQANILQRPPQQKKCNDVRFPTTQCERPMLNQLEQCSNNGIPNCQKIGSNGSSLTTSSSTTASTIQCINNQLGNADVHPPTIHVNEELDVGCSENTITQQKRQHMQGGFRDVNVEGQTFRVLMGMDPLHVQQWRRDRCKNWPSQENIRRKSQELQQREKSGALVTNIEQQSKGPLQHKHGSGSRQRHRHQIYHTTEATAKTSSSPKEEVEIVVDSCASISRQKALVVNEDEIEEATSKKNEGQFSCHSRRIQICKRFAKGMCKYGDACKFQHSGVKIRQRKRKNLIETTAVMTHPKGDSSLLRALLRKEIRQETNILLQCIRYLVENFIQPCETASAAISQ